jgi:hypothetical protein
VVFVKATLAIDAVEGAYFAISRLQVDTQRNAETAAMNRPKDGRWIDYCAHNDGKITK